MKKGIIELMSSMLPKRKHVISFEQIEQAIRKMEENIVKLERCRRLKKYGKRYCKKHL